MAQPYELDWTRLPLEGAHNVRELGGYPVSGGGQTRYHRFLRADGLNNLTEHDREFLYGYGVRTVIDLRDSFEVEQDPDQMIGGDVVWANYPLLGLNIADFESVQSFDDLERQWTQNPPAFTEVYDMILSARENIRRCFELIAEAPEGCVLFHCMAGKDRTGILAMLLMSLAGCDKWDCVASYMQSRVNLMRNGWYAADWERQEEMEGRENFSDSPIYAIDHAWETVQAQGGVVPYLRACGVTHDQLAVVRSRLLG